MSDTKKYHGVIIPAVTPLTAHYTLDHEAVEKMFVNFYAHNVMPFILGTTGEASSMPAALKNGYLKLASKLKKTGTTLYAGVSSNSFDEAADFAKSCFDNGVDVVAATLPSYYTLSEAQIKKYFEQLADNIPGPLIIYNIPATTHMSIPLELIEELSYHDNIVGTKDSERSEERLKESISLWSNREDFSHFLGWAAKSAEALIQGSDGLIPSTGNLYPKLYEQMLHAAETGNYDEAHKLQKLSDVLGNLYQQGRLLGESLWALKVLMREVGLCQPYMMPPLQPLSPAEEARLVTELHELTIKEGISLSIKH